MLVMVGSFRMRAGVFVVLVREVEAVYLFLSHSCDLAEYHFDQFVDRNQQVVNPVARVGHFDDQQIRADEVPVSYRAVSHFLRSDGFDFYIANHVTFVPSFFSICTTRSSYSVLSSGSLLAVISSGCPTCSFNQSWILRIWLKRSSPTAPLAVKMRTSLPSATQRFTRLTILGIGSPISSDHP